MRHDFDQEVDVCTRCNFTREAIMNFAVSCGEKWERRGRLLTDFKAGVTKQHESIAAAKRASRKLQQGSLGLGRGEMRIIR